MPVISNFTFHGAAPLAPEFFESDPDSELPLSGFDFYGGAMEVVADQLILNPRELEVTTRTALGETSIEIGHVLRLHEITIRNEISTIRGKLGISGHTGFLLGCIKRGVMRRTKLNDSMPLDTTPRQEQVLELLAGGSTNVQISNTFNIGIESIKTHVDRVRQKTLLGKREIVVAAFVLSRDTIGDTIIHTYEPRTPA